jgi:hypothetical protein
MKKFDERRERARAPKRRNWLARGLAAAAIVATSALAGAQVADPPPPTATPTPTPPIDLRELARQRRDGQAIAERVRKAYAEEVRALSRSLKMESELSARLAEAYVRVREAHPALYQKAMNDYRQSLADGTAATGRPEEIIERMRGMEGEVRRRETAMLLAGFEEFIEEAHRERLELLLGAHSVEWDRMTSALLDMNLESAAFDSAMDAVLDYVEALEWSRQERRSVMTVAEAEARAKALAENPPPARPEPAEAWRRLEESLEATIDKQGVARLKAYLRNPRPSPPPFDR